MSCERVENSRVIDIHRFLGRRQFAMALRAAKSVAESFVDHSIASTALRTGYKQPARVRLDVFHDQRASGESITEKDNLSYPAIEEVANES